jgi:hypothetical protein
MHEAITVANTLESDFRNTYDSITATNSGGPASNNC